MRATRGSDWFHDQVTVPDVQECRSLGIDYQPCVLPADLQERQRRHGDFMWRQFWNLIRAGADGLYVSMFDEYNEGNQIARTAETAADYYLRLSGDGGRMLKGEIALTSVRPTAPVLGGAPVTAVGLRSRSNGLFVGGSPLRASLTTPSETYEIVDAGTGWVALRSTRTGRFVCAEQAGARRAGRRPGHDR